MTVTVVLSDLHANGRALRAALAHARDHGFDRMVILGDLLTYGIDQDEVLDIVQDLAENCQAKVVLGNHDQLYLDLAKEQREYYARLPEWLRESIDRTYDRLDSVGFANRFPWIESIEQDSWLFSHANPWTYGNWRYLYTPEDAREAADSLRSRGLFAGVFGHTHRRHALSFDHVGSRLGDCVALGDDWTVETTSLQTLVVNPGSIGQPRHQDLRSTYLRIEQHGSQTMGSLIGVAYDVDSHLRALRSSHFTDQTCARLCRFFEPTS